MKYDELLSIIILVGGLGNVYFFHTLDIASSQLTFIFFKGLVYHQPDYFMN